MLDPEATIATTTGLLGQDALLVVLNLAPRHPLGQRATSQAQDGSMRRYARTRLTALLDGRRFLLFGHR